MEYKVAQNRAVKEFRKAKKKFEQKIARDARFNLKKFYSYVRSKTQINDVVGPLKDSDGNKITDPTKMSNMLNDYFGTVFNDDDEASNLPKVNTMFQGESNHMLNKIVC